MTPDSAVIDRETTSETASDTVGSAPAFTLPDIDEDTRADFAAVGIVLGTEADMDRRQREVEASIFLRLAAEATDELNELSRVMFAQIDVVKAHYERKMSSLRTKRDGFTRQVEHLALLAIEAGDFGKKKSADTPYGAFGVEDRKATVAVADDAALLAHLVANDPAHVRVDASLSLSQAREYLSPTELAQTKMKPAWGELKKTLDPSKELPPGVVKVDATRTAFAKPDPFAIAAKTAA
jgi:hypothetical protein